MIERITQIVEEIEKLHPNDIKIYEYWDELTNILSKDEQATITYISNCQDKVIISNLSSVFEDIAYNLQSIPFIKELDKLKKKYPDLNLSSMIEIAKSRVE